MAHTTDQDADWAQSAQKKRYTSLHGILPNNMAAQYVNEYVSAMQRGADPRYLKLVEAAKHFAYYEKEDTFATDRLAFDANVSAQDQVEYTYYWPPSAPRGSEC